MEAVRNVAVREVLEGDEVGINNAGVLGGSGVLPAEGLACGEREGKGEVLAGEVERDPLALRIGFCRRRSEGFENGSSCRCCCCCWWWWPLLRFDGAASFLES